MEQEEEKNSRARTGCNDMHTQWWTSKHIREASCSVNDTKMLEKKTCAKIAE